MAKRQANARVIKSDVEGTYRRERVKSAHRASRAWQSGFYITESGGRVKVNNAEVFVY